MKTKLVPTFALAAVLALTGIGCTASYSHTEMKTISSGDLPATVTRQRIQISVGAIAHAEIQPFNTDDNPMIGDVQSSDPNVIEVIAGAKNDTYAFLGHKVGKATVSLYAGGVLVGDIPAEVVDQ